jgi:signal transduction histidine kinase
MARAAGFVVVGAFTFTAKQGRGTQLDMEIAAFTLTGLLMAAWALSDRSARARAHWARWLPVALGVIAIACASASATASGGPLIALALMATLSAGSDISITAGWTVLAAGVLAIETGALAYRSGSWPVFGFPLMLLVALLVGRNRRAYRVQAEQAAALLAQVEQLRAEQHRVDVLDERTRIAREIHDVLAHSLGALALQIQVARAVLKDKDDRRQTLALLDEAQRMAKDGLSETRRAVHALRAGTPPLPEALAGLAAAHQLRHRAPVTLQVSGEPRPLTPEANLALTRTAQETLVNSAKHAPRAAVDLRLDYGDQQTVLTAMNELPDAVDAKTSGFESVNGGYGLTGMRERLLLLGGTLRAGADSGRWVVTAQVPN